MIESYTLNKPLNNKTNSDTILAQITASAKDEVLNFIYLGKQEYNKMWKIQKQIHELVKNDNMPSIVLFLEHDHVYTFGKNSNKDFLLNSYPDNTQIVESDRGGQITYHGPGQLIGYPIINLNHFTKSVSWFMRSLEQIIIMTLHEYNISADRKEGMTGVWVDNEKICAMGVRLSRWTSMHGFALNIKPDMKYFDCMIPCGIFDYGVTSMYDVLSEEIEVKEIIEKISNNFTRVFKRSN